MKAAEGSSIAICISFSACTSVSSPLELLRRGEGSGMGRLKGTYAGYTWEGARCATDNNGETGGRSYSIANSAKTCTTKRTRRELIANC